MATVKKEGDRINQFITAPEVRVVHDKRGSLGIMSIKDALALACFSISQGRGFRFS